MFPSTKFRVLALLIFTWSSSSAYKLSDAPIQLTDTPNKTEQKIIEEVVSENLKEEMTNIEQIPNPANGNNNSDNSSDNSSGSASGFGELAKNLEFILVKVAQLESVIEMQEGRIQTQELQISEQRKAILSLAQEKGVKVGLSLMEVEQKDSEAQLREAQDIVKKVFEKHHRQRTTGKFHEEEASAQGDEGGASSEESASWPWNHRRRRWNPVDHAKRLLDTMEDGYRHARDKARWVRDNAINTVEKAVRILSSGFSNFGANCNEFTWPRIEHFDRHSGLQIRFGRMRCRISLIGQSTNLFGFDFGTHRLGLPEQVRQILSTGTMEINAVLKVGGKIALCWPRNNGNDYVKCLANYVMSLKSPLDYLPEPVKKVANGQIMDLVPSQVRQVVNWNEEAVRTVFSVGFELMHCRHRGHHHDILRCLGGWIMSLRNPLDFLPDRVKKLANGQIMDLVPDPLKKIADGKIMDLVPSQVKQVVKWNEEAVRTVFSVGFELMHCRHRGHHHDLIRCLGNWIMQLKPPLQFLPDPVKKLASGKIMELVPDPVRKVADGKILDLVAGPVRTVATGKILDLLPDPVKKVASGRVLELLPDPVKKVASGRVLELLPDPVNKVASGRVLELLPDPVNKVASGKVMDLLPNPVNKVASGQIMDLMDGRLKKVASGDMMDLMPEQLQLLGGGEVNSIRTALTMGNELMKCSNPTNQGDLIQCLGFKIVGSVPPLNFLNRLGEIFSEFIEVFAKVAATVATQAMKGGSSLLQTATASDFPPEGAPEMVHHRGPNLVITKHSQRVPSGQAELIQELAEKAKGDDNPPAAVKWEFGDYGPEMRGLVTQFNGREIATGSCLAFAPRNKTGSNNQATQEDWQVPGEDDFLQLEPWAVPCSNQWMKDNWNKWQGYSFYTSDAFIEKCVTITFALNMQPVVAFVGGIQFDLLPGPLAEVATQVCWPRHQPGGLDLSVLRSEIKSNGVLLFSRTLRLSKRFGKDTHFTAENVNGGHQTARSYFGVAAPGESGSGMASMKRSSLLESNRSQESSQVQDSLYWKLEEDDLFLSSVEYGKDLGMNKTSEFRGKAVKDRLSAFQSGTEESADWAGDNFQLFGFRNPGMVNFAVKGLLQGNWLKLGLQMGFASYQSPEATIPLINLADQFALILAAMPDELVSVESRARAIAALKDFSRADVGQVKAESKAVKVADKRKDGKDDWSYEVSAPPVATGQSRHDPPDDSILLPCQGSHVEGASCSHLEEADCNKRFVTVGVRTMQCAWLDGRCLTMGSDCMTTTSTTTTTSTSTTTTSTSTFTTTTRTSTTTSTFTTTTTTLLVEAYLEDGLLCTYFYNQAQCQVPDLGTLTAGGSVVVPEIFMEKGRFPGTRQGDNFCMRCSGQIITRNAGNYKFYLSSDDGSLLYLNGEKIVDNNGCHGEQERQSTQRSLHAGKHELTVDFCEAGGGEVLKLRYEGPDTGNAKVTVPAPALKHEFQPLADGLECEYFYNQARCAVPDLATLIPGQSLVVPEIFFGSFPDVRQNDNFCMRCTGQLVTQKTGDYRFFLTSDDGSLLFLNGEKVVDNDGCHGSQERGSYRKFLSAGTHPLVVDMCEMGGGQSFHLRYQGPDTNNAKVIASRSVLKHELKPLVDGLECEYFYNQAQCAVPDLAKLMPGQSLVVPEIFFGSFPDVRQNDNFCMRCSGYLLTRMAGDYKFFLSSDDGSLMYLNGEKIVDNDGCHGERERHSHHKSLSVGAHHVVLDMCEMGGGQNFKFHYQGPDTGVAKVKVPSSVLRHEAKLSDGLECDYFYGRAQCQVPDLKAMTPAHTAILPQILMENRNFPNLWQSDNFCIRCTGHLITKYPGSYKFFLNSDDGSLLYLNGEKLVDNDGCHGPREREGENFLAAGAHRLEVSMCDKGLGESFKMHYEGPDSGNAKVTVPRSVLKHEIKHLSDGLECVYFYNQAQCMVPDLGTGSPGNSVVVPDIFMEMGRFRGARQGNNFCLRCSGQLSVKTPGNYKFFTSSDDGSLLYLSGEKLVDNNGCHGERERQGEKFLAAGSYDLVVDMCEMGGGEVFKMHYQGPDSGNAKVRVPAHALKHAQAAPKPAAGASMVAWFRSEEVSADWKSVVGNLRGRVTKGGVSRKVESGHGARKPVAYLAGSTGAGYDFGRIMKRDYSICSISRYTGRNKRRILQAGHPNFLHGHWAHRAGVAHYGTWVTSHEGPASEDWIALCGNRAGLVFRGREKISNGRQPGAASDFHLYINEGRHEFSDFGVMEVIVWDRLLTEDEMLTTMEYLNWKLEHGSQ